MVLLSVVCATGLVSLQLSGVDVVPSLRGWIRLLVSHVHDEYNFGDP